jgi:dephospho-CoA kinase
MLIALTGGIGSGKSTVAKRFVELGATEVDADLLAREVVQPGTRGLAEVAEAFGSDLITPSGELNRALLATRAFSSPEARAKLESILHPKIQKLSRERIAQSPGHVVYTIPLLVETASKLPFDKVVTISCPIELRVQRLIARGLQEQDARARIAAQASDDQREELADFVIDSDCSLDELTSRADDVWKRITS